MKIILNESNKDVLLVVKGMDPNKKDQIRSFEAKQPSRQHQQPHLFHGQFDRLNCRWAVGNTWRVPCILHLSNTVEGRRSSTTFEIIPLEIRILLVSSPFSILPSPRHPIGGPLVKLVYRYLDGLVVERRGRFVTVILREFRSLYPRLGGGVVLFIDGCWWFAVHRCGSVVKGERGIVGAYRKVSYFSFRCIHPG